MFSVLLRSGLPKASRMSHYKMMAGGHLLNCVAMTSDDVMYVTLPLYHISALLFGLSNVIRNGKKTEQNINPIFSIYVHKQALA